MVPEENRPRRGRVSGLRYLIISYYIMCFSDPHQSEWVKSVFDLRTLPETLRTLYPLFTDPASFFTDPTSLHEFFVRSLGNFNVGLVSS